MGPYGGITGRRRRRIKGTLLSSSRIASLFVSPYRFPLSSHRTVFPSRLPVNFLYGAKWLWFYGFKEPTPTTLGPVRGHYGQTKKEVQNQRRLGPYGGITGGRRGRFKTNATWARTGALRADGEGESRARSSRLPASPHSLSHRTVFPSRLTVPFSPLVSP